MFHRIWLIYLFGVSLSSLEDVNAEDKKTLTELENMLDELRRHVGDEGYQGEMTDEDIYEDCQENDEEYEM